MLGDPFPIWGLLQSGVSAASGLLGVIIGGWITFRNQRAERRRIQILDQLRQFYAPLLAIRREILSKSRLRQKLHKAIAEDCADSHVQLDMETHQEVAKVWEPFHRHLDYSESQLMNDLLPLYRRMLALYRENLWLAEISTLRFHDELAEFVELWNRHLAAPLPVAVAIQVGHDENKLRPFYDDLQCNFDRLSYAVKR